MVHQIIGNTHNMQEVLTTTHEEEKQDIAQTFATIDDFQKIEIRIGTVISVTLVEGADKLYILQVDLGEAKPRQILSGIREFVSEEELLNKQFPFVTNLAPRMLRGHESQGMILAGNDATTFALLSPTKALANGVRLR